jgi:UDP-N-acetylglucosamine:LPS N-acetylglucosamine transferase
MDDGMKIWLRARSARGTLYRAETVTPYLLETIADDARRRDRRDDVVIVVEGGAAGATRLREWMRDARASRVRVRPSSARRTGSR